MGVQKVMYYAHGWYLAERGEPLIRQDFQAWRLGPVQKLVWDCFRSFGSGYVDARASKFDLVTRVATEVCEKIPADTSEFLRQIVLGYGHIDAFELSNMTHERGGPWDQVWNAPNGQITLGMRISHESIRRHFQLARRIRPTS